jgi:hypothetical protein
LTSFNNVHEKLGSNYRICQVILDNYRSCGLDCEVDQMELILGLRNKMTVREMVSRLSYKEVEEF